MKERTDTFIYRPSGAEFEYFTEDAILYDIETTGLSPRRDQVYCIGCCTRQGENVTFRQFFAETPMEEEAVLSAFADLLSRYPVCITFNGMRFDEPFLRTRLKQYKKTTASPRPAFAETEIDRAVSRDRPAGPLWRRRTDRGLSYIHEDKGGRTAAPFAPA